MPHNQTDPCIDLLDRASNSPPKNIREVGEFLALFTSCFISLARSVSRIDRMVYGSDDKPGIDETIRNMDERLKKHEADEISRMMQIQSDIKNMAASKPADAPKPDTFTTALIWFRDKVLPQLVTAAISGGIVWIVAVNSLLKP